MEFQTETGSTYEVEDDMIRRVEHTHDMRRDGEWLRILKIIYPIEVGSRAYFLLEPLGEGAITTLRLTSLVTDIRTQD
jgi:hypothetical protein